MFCYSLLFQLLAKYYSKELNNGVCWKFKNYACQFTSKFLLGPPVWGPDEGGWGVESGISKRKHHADYEVLHSQEGREYPTYNKKKEGELDFLSHTRIA